MKTKILKRNTILTVVFMLILTILTIVSFTIVSINTDTKELHDYAEISCDQIAIFDSINDIYRFVYGKDGGNLNVTFFDKNGDIISSTYNDEEVIGNTELIKDVAQKEDGYSIQLNEKPAKSIRKSLVIYKKVVVGDNVSPDGMFIVRFSRLALVTSESFWILTIALSLFWVMLASFLIFMLNHNIKTSMAPLIKVESIMRDIQNGEYKESQEKIKDESELGRMVVEIDKIGGMINKSMVKLEDEKNKIDAILKSISQGIIVLDINGNIVETNGVIEQMLGRKILSKEDLKNVKELEDVYKIFSQSFEEKIEKKSNLHINDKYLNIESVFIPENKEGYCMIILATDVTEIMKTDIAKVEFFANASHELKTPLTAISGYSEVLSLEPNEKQMKKCAKEIHKNSLKMKNLIDSMLQISKLDSKVQADEKEMINLYSMCKDCIDEQLVTAKKKNIKVEISGQASMIGNYKMILMLIKNLISNAIKYNNEGGNVWINLDEDEDFAKLVVKDNGIGIAKENLEKIFDRFYRVDEAHSSKDGESSTGLGLAIVKNVVQMHNGSIKVNSELNKGSEFIVTFKKR